MVPIHDQRFCRSLLTVLEVNFEQTWITNIITYSNGISMPLLRSFILNHDSSNMGLHWTTLRSETISIRRDRQKDGIWWNAGSSHRVSFKPQEPLGTCSFQILWCPKIQWIYLSNLYLPIYLSIYLSIQHITNLTVCFCFQAPHSLQSSLFSQKSSKNLWFFLDTVLQPFPSAAHTGWETGWKAVSWTFSSRHLSANIDSMTGSHCAGQPPHNLHPQKWGFQ